jgi:hypothetical protein
LTAGRSRTWSFTIAHLARRWRPGAVFLSVAHCEAKMLVQMPSTIAQGIGSRHEDLCPATCESRNRIQARSASPKPRHLTLSRGPRTGQPPTVPCPGSRHKARIGAAGRRGTSCNLPRKTSPSPGPLRVCQKADRCKFRSDFTKAADINGGAEGNRTPDLLNAIQALSQLSYGPGVGAGPITRPPNHRKAGVHECRLTA